MRWKASAGVLVALAFLIPAAPASAQAAQPGLDKTCQTVERTVYKDIRELITIDLETATDTEVRVVANQVLSQAKAESLPVLTDAVQKQLDGTPEGLRTFLRDDVENAWSVALRIMVGRTLTDAGKNVQAAAQKVLGAGSIETYLAYLNEGVYAARELDCASQPTPTPTVTPGTGATPSASATAAPTATSSDAAAPGGEGGGLPVTGANTAVVAAVGVAILALGGVAFWIGRRRRSRFVA